MRFPCAFFFSLQPEQTKPFFALHLLQIANTGKYVTSFTARTMRGIYPANEVLNCRMQETPKCLNGGKGMDATRTLGLLPLSFTMGILNSFISILFALETYLNKTFEEKEELLILISYPLCAACRTAHGQRWFKSMRAHLHILEGVSWKLRLGLPLSHQFCHVAEAKTA